MTFVCLTRRTSHKMACSMTIFCARQTSVAFGGPLHDVRLGRGGCAGCVMRAVHTGVTETDKQYEFRRKTPLPVLAAHRLGHPARRLCVHGDCHIQRLRRVELPDHRLHVHRRTVRDHRLAVLPVRHARHAGAAGALAGGGPRDPQQTHGGRHGAQDAAGGAAGRACGAGRRDIR